MNILEKIIEHFLLSLTALNTSKAYQEVLSAYYAYVPVFFILMPVIGFFIVVRLRTRSPFFYFIYKRGTLIIIAFLIVVLAGFSLLYLKSLKIYYLIPFIISIIILLLSVGFRLAVIIKGNNWALLYMFVVVILFIGTYLFSGAPTFRNISLGASKSELKDTFRGVAGREPDRDEKRSFWKGAVGEENPSESKKDQYWKGK